MRTFAASLIAVLLGGPIGLCAGWQATPEARMACCADGVACPMHAAGHDDPSHKRAITQAQADACCASGERGNSTPIAKTPTVSPAVVSQTTLLAPVSIPRLLSWSDAVPDHADVVPRHILLSVFLI